MGDLSTSAPGDADGTAAQEFGRWERGQHFATYELLLGEYIARTILDRAKPPSLLDVACGNGVLTRMLAPAFQRVVGIDISESAIEHARANCPGAEFVVGRAEDYVADRPFTMITLVNLIEHVLDPVRLLGSLARSLEPGGEMFVCVPNALAVNRRIARRMGSLRDEYELSPFDIEVAGHRRSYDMQLLERDVCASGLRVTGRGGVFYKMLSQAQMNWLLEKGPWGEGGFGWGRVGEEGTKDWRRAFCDACYEFGKEHAEDCNIVYVVATR